MEQLTVGLLAHVDAGKTTLSEGLLYRGGRLKRLGRVDHQDAFLDTDSLERERGITIFSKQAVLPLERRTLTLLDTPGHVDFSAEMERTLQVLDCAVLVVSGTDGVQGHTRTLWRLLERYQVPVFLFINKMDLAGADRGEVLAALTARRKRFPCYFGSALKLEGVDDLLEGLERYAPRPVRPEEFGARVFKITRDGQGARLTWLKVTGGRLKVKDVLTNQGENVPEDQVWREKTDQIRIYSGEKYQSVDAAEAGTVCAVTGLSRTFPGQGLGAEGESAAPVLEPVLTYRMDLPE